MVDSSKYYIGDFGHIFNFNDPVIAECCLAPENDRIGRLVQVRKKIGAWGSDIYFIRRDDGSLMTFENVSLRKFHGNIAPPHPDDNIHESYTVKGKHPETGFVIESPSGPPALNQTFSMVVSGKIQAMQKKDE